MKKIIVIAIALLAAVGAYAQEGRNIYNKYSDSQGVSAVYISPAMFKLIGKIPELNVEVAEGENMDLAPLIRSFSGFYMLDMSGSQQGSSLAEDVKAMISKGRYELLMEVKDDGDNVNIYTVGNDKTIESFVFLCRSGNDVQFICIDGTMDRKEVETLIAKAAASSM